MMDKNNEKMSTFGIMAMLFESVAEEVISKFGEDGKKAIEEAVFKFGTKRGQEIRRKTLEAGEQLTFENYLKNYDMERSSEFKSDTKIGENFIDQDISICPLGNGWRGNPEIGKLYCNNVDKGLAYGYDPDILYNLEKHILRGDELCCLRFRKK